MSPAERKFVIVYGSLWLLLLVSVLSAIWNILNIYFQYKHLLATLLVTLPLCIFIWFVLPMLIFLPLTILMVICIHKRQLGLLSRIYQYALFVWERLPIRKAEMFATAMAASGVIARMQGNYQSSESLLNRSIQLLEKRKKPRPLSQAITLTNLSGLYLKQDRNIEAEDFARRAISLWQAHPGGEPCGQACAITNLAFVQMRCNHYQQAEENFGKAMELFTKPTSLVPTTILMYQVLCILGLAELKYRQGNHSDCQKLYQQAMKLSEDNKVPPNPFILEPLNQIGLLLSKDGQYKQSEEVLKQACTIGQIVPAHPEAVESFSNYAALLKKTGRSE